MAPRTPVPACCSSFLIKEVRLVAHGAAEVVLGMPTAGAPDHYSVTLCPPGGGAGCKSLDCPRSLCGTFTGLVAGLTYTVTATATMAAAAAASVAAAAASPLSAANTLTVSVPAPTAPTLLSAVYMGSAQAHALPPSQGTPCMAVRALGVAGPLGSGWAAPLLACLLICRQAAR